ncbi:MAG TPA: DUF748 domain-containing protein [Cytophagaceae bacterium]|jgi:hypothetical protein|nr:DUF748 domain-containing protein [Cytophagaceae bacterium]
MLKSIRRHWGKVTLLLVILLFISARLMLPFFVIKYVNKVLSELKGYTGKIKDVDIALIRGAYVIKEIQLDKTGGKVPVPFAKCKTMDLAIEWKALLHLEVKAKVKLEKLVLNFVAGPTKETSQSGKEADWTKALDKLLPIDVNRFEVRNGTVTYRDFNTTPKVNIYLDDLELIAINLSNIVDKQKVFPSSLYISSGSIGGGKLLITGGLNVMKKIPDADLNVKFTEVDLKAFNDLTMAYAKFDFERGKLALFSQMSMLNGKIDGYVKPLMTDIKVLNWSKEKEPVTNKIWQGIIGLMIDVVKNHPKDQFATKLEVHGSIHKKEIDVWQAVLNVLRNGFIKAFEKKFDDPIDLEKELDRGLSKQAKKEAKK